MRTTQDNAHVMRCSGEIYECSSVGRRPEYRLRCGRCESSTFGSRNHYRATFAEKLLEVQVQSERTPASPRFLPDPDTEVLEVVCGFFRGALGSSEVAHAEKTCGLKEG